MGRVGGEAQAASRNKPTCSTRPGFLPEPVDLSRSVRRRTGGTIHRGPDRRSVRLTGRGERTMSVTTSVVGVSSPSGTPTTTSPAGHHRRPPNSAASGSGVPTRARNCPRRGRHSAATGRATCRDGFAGLAGPVPAAASARQLLSTTGVVDDRTLAAPSTVLQAGRDLVRPVSCRRTSLASLRRAVIGLAIGVIDGCRAGGDRRPVPLGEDVVDSAVQVLRRSRCSGCCRWSSSGSGSASSRRSPSSPSARRSRSTSTPTPASAASTPS